MIKRFGTLSLVGATALLLAGCATTGSVKNALATANQGVSDAAAANGAAGRAQSSADGAAAAAGRAQSTADAAGGAANGAMGAAQRAGSAADAAGQSSRNNASAITRLNARIHRLEVKMMHKPKHRHHHNKARATK